VNWLHGKYNISNGDYLYTLSLFVFEPITWAERYGWRCLSPLEAEAYYVYWKEVGKHMEIKNIPETLESLKEWSKTYELENSIPADTNRDIAGYTTDELLHSVPKMFGIKEFARKLTICLLDEPGRISMLQPAQPWYLHAFVKGIMHTVSYYHRFLCLPRRSPSLLVDRRVPKTINGAPPRLNPTRWQAKPWYKPQARGLQWVVDRLAVMVGYYDDHPGPQYKSEGYRIEEMGPEPLEHLGHEKVMQNAEQIFGCPIVGPWALPLDENKNCRM